MIGFHIDMNMAHYRVEYLHAWLHELARLGYDTIVWEIENSVAWESCPECVAPDALEKEAFRKLLDESRTLGLRSIPLLQTLGNVEYVLKHDAYRELRELPEHNSQYCPRSPEVVSLLHRWVDEYLALFGPVEYFHLGGNEARLLGRCPACRTYVEEYSVSKLYVDHINTLAKPLIKRGVTPIIWADMLLACPDALDELAHETMLFDWRPDIYHGCGRICMWPRSMTVTDGAPRLEQSMIAPEQMSAEEQALFGPYVYPTDDQLAPRVFYTADFLSDKGFRVVTCPSSSHEGDSVFAPRDRLHAANVFDSFHKGIEDSFWGSVLMSRSLHLFPWELQASTLAIPQFVHTHSHAGLEEFRDQFALERFGRGGEVFQQVTELLSGPCLFSEPRSLGFDRSIDALAGGVVRRTLTAVWDEGGVRSRWHESERRLEEYSRAFELLAHMQRTVRRGHPVLNMWKLAARNLVNRAEVALFLLANAEQIRDDHPLAAGPTQRARLLLGRQRMLQKETAAFYHPIMRPSRTSLVLHYLYGALDEILEELVKR